MSKDNDLPFPEDENSYNIVLSVGKQELYSKEFFKNKAVEDMMPVKEGMVDVTEVYAKLKGIIEYASQCIETIKEDVVDEVTKYGVDGVTKSNIKLITKNQGKKYSFEDNNDWVELDDKIKELTEKKKDIESKMKALVGTAGYVDAETGEMLPPATVLSEGKTVVQATIPKK